MQACAGSARQLCLDGAPAIPRSPMFFAFLDTPFLWAALGRYTPLVCCPLLFI